MWKTVYKDKNKCGKRIQGQEKTWKIFKTVFKLIVGSGFAMLTFVSVKKRNSSLVKRRNRNTYIDDLYVH